MTIKDYPPEVAKLDQRRRTFVIEYVQNGQNGTRAAKKAGYKGGDKALSVNAARLLGNVRVKDAIKAMTFPAVKKALVSVEEVVEQLKRPAFAIVQRPVSWKDQISALTKLGEYLKMFKEDGNIQNNHVHFHYNKDLSPDDQRRELLQFIRSRQ